MSLSCNESSENFEEDFTLKSCPTCERTFNPKALERHQKICEKTKKCTQRTPFNSFLQRAKEIGTLPVKPESKEKSCTKNRKKWREEHESLMRVIKLGKSDSKDLLNNGRSPQKTTPPGYQQCSSCERYFSEKAADRHISWCLEQKTRLPKTPTNTEAMERLRARVKYQAPLPKKRNLNNLNERLVKSAESVRESSSFRLHSSPPIPSKEGRLLSRRLPSASNLGRCKALEKSSTYSLSNINTSLSGSSKENNEASRTKKAVKFKEMFPIHDKERNRNLDMLAALRLRLSELSVSEDLVGESDFKQESSASLQNHSSVPCLAVQGRWSEDQEQQQMSTSGPLNHTLPRFCYNCGTKYPIDSAKFCCECGAQRFIFSLSDTRMSVP